MPSHPTYAAFVGSQQRALLRQFIDDPGQCLIGIPAPAALQQRYFRRGRIVALADVPVREALVYLCPDGAPELWVAPVDKSDGPSARYRTHWASFVAAYGAGPVAGSILGRPQVIDHVLPETFAARQNYSHVRLMAIDSRPNATVGSAIEKRMAQRINPGKSMLADAFTAAKISGYPGSFALAINADAAAADLVRHLQSRGLVLSPADLELMPRLIAQSLAWARTT